jgi:hypothetical protein
VLWLLQIEAVLLTRDSHVASSFWSSGATVTVVLRLTLQACSSIMKGARMLALSLFKSEYFMCIWLVCSCAGALSPSGPFAYSWVLPQSCDACPASQGWPQTPPSGDIVYSMDKQSRGHHATVTC